MVLYLSLENHFCLWTLCFFPLLYMHISSPPENHCLWRDATRVNMLCISVTWKGDYEPKGARVRCKHAYAREGMSRWEGQWLNLGVLPFSVLFNSLSLTLALNAWLNGWPGSSKDPHPVLLQPRGHRHAPLPCLVYTDAKVLSSEPSSAFPTHFVDSILLWKQNDMRKKIWSEQNS